MKERLVRSASRMLESPPECRWLAPVASLQLPGHEVHVWRVALDRNDAARCRLLDTLSRDERDRASRFHFERDRQRFIIGRGALRDVLARYLGPSPAELRFEYGEYGKPGLPAESSSEPLHFNVSHSAGLALIAVARSEVGVDLEWIRADLATRQIAERFFSPAEIAALVAVPPSLRVAAFFHCWTQKEAYLKARGAGLTFPLDGFDVTVMPGAPPTLCTRDDPDEGLQWSLAEIAPAPGYAAALAVRGLNLAVKYWDWDG